LGRNNLDFEHEVMDMEAGDQKNSGHGKGVRVTFYSAKAHDYIGDE
jgi:hypothetical protein